MRHTPVRSRKDRAKDVDAQPTDCSKSHALPALSCITEENAHRPESGTCAPHVCTVRSADAWQTAHWRHFCKKRKPDLSPASRPQRNQKQRHVRLSFPTALPPPYKIYYTTVVTVLQDFCWLCRGTFTILCETAYIFTTIFVVLSQKFRRIACLVL